MNDNTEILKVLIVDDHDLLRDSLQKQLERVPDFIFEIQQASCGEAAVEMASKNNFDFILMDYNMRPGITGAEAIKCIKAIKPGVKILGCSSFGEAWLVADMMDAGANGFLIKHFNVAEIPAAIKAVQEGGCYYSPGVKEELERYNSL